MKIETYIDSLISHAIKCGLAEPVDRQVLVNRLLDLLRKLFWLAVGAEASPADKDSTSDCLAD